MKTLEDCGILRIIGKSTAEALAAPCSKEDIKARQELFGLLFDVNFSELFDGLLKAFGDYEYALNVYTSAENECEEYFCFLKYYLKYIGLINAVLKLGQPCSLLKELYSYARKISDSVNEDDIREYSSLLEKISHSVLRISYGQAYLMKGDGDCGENAVTKLLDSGKNRLGYTEDVKKASPLRMPLPISEALVKLYASETEALSALKPRLESIIDRDILNIKKEMLFYSDIVALVKKAREYGIESCFASVSEKRRFYAEAASDITLTVKRSPEDKIISNDIRFDTDTPCFFLTGANGGGKTTYLRTVCVNLILSMRGCPVFCKSAEIYPFTSVYSHFPADEHFDAGGRLSDEKIRVDRIIGKSDEGTFAFFNETFTGADDIKGYALSVDTVRKLNEKKAFCLFVTHFHEVERTDIPILCAMVDTDNENKRTFIIKRSNGNKSSYASDILKKYGIDGESLAKALREVKTDDKSAL